VRASGGFSASCRATWCPCTRLARPSRLRDQHPTRRMDRPLRSQRWRPPLEGSRSILPLRLRFRLLRPPRALPSSGRRTEEWPLCDCPRACGEVAYRLGLDSPFRYLVSKSLCAWTAVAGSSPNRCRRTTPVALGSRISTLRLPQVRLKTLCSSQTRPYRDAKRRNRLAGLSR
jgi:hypothetical protein